MIKGSILQEDIAVLKMCVPNIRESNCMGHKLMELQGEIDSWSFNTSVSEMDTSGSQKISKDITEFLQHHKKTECN